MTREIERRSACSRCGRKLKDKKSQKRGLGPVCYQKYLKDQSEIGFEKDQLTIFDELVV